MNGDEYLDQSALALQPWFVGRKDTFAAGCRLLRQLRPSPLPETTSYN